MSSQGTAEKVGKTRVDETYLLAQVNYHRDSDTFRDHKERIAAGESLYNGRLEDLFPEESALPRIPYVENKFKNSLHDITRLASEGRGAVKSIPRGDRDKDMRMAQVSESINEGYWVINKMKNQERQFYLDLAGTGMMAACVYFDEDRSPYPMLHRLDPRFGFPDVRNGIMQTYLNVEETKERILARAFPHLGLDDTPDNTREALFIAYYDDNEVAEAVLWGSTKSGGFDQGAVTKSWPHGLGRVPVGFEMLDTYDSAFHGLFEQLAGPLMVRNKIVRFMVDVAEQAAHAPKVEMGVENWDADEGPTTTYHLDPNAERSSLGRLEPASASGDIWRMLSYMGDQEEKEGLQPPSRSGNVSQSIASGSFVDRTQGQLTSVVKELQDKMASFREQLNEICMKVDENFLDAPKALYRPVSGKKMYTPSEDIDGWYLHEVKFGAGAGLDRLNADTRVLNHLTARLISRQEARAEIDYLDDSASSQDKIDQENLQDVIFQRLVSDPATPIAAIAPIWLLMKQEGKSLEEALQEKMPELLEAAAAAQQQAGAPLPAAGGEVPPEGAAPAEGPSPAQGELLKIAQQAPPIAQLFPGRNFNT